MVNAVFTATTNKWKFRLQTLVQETPNGRTSDLVDGDLCELDVEGVRVQLGAGAVEILADSRVT